MTFSTRFETRSSLTCVVSLLLLITLIVVALEVKCFRLLLDIRFQLLNSVRSSSFSEILQLFSGLDGTQALFLWSHAVVMCADHNWSKSC